MKYNKLGKTDINVSHVCLGTMTWGCQNTESEGHEQMDYALEHGINFFDTAELYAVPPSPETQGLTEKYIGTWFKKTGNRDKVVLASKVAGSTIPWIHDGLPIGKEKIDLAIEGSLKRLQTDYMDLYQLHWPNYAYPHHGKHGAGKIDYTSMDAAQIEDNFLEILETLDGYVKSGKIRAFGLSNDTPWAVMKYIELSKKHNLPRVASIQNEYSLLYRGDEPYLAETCAHENVSYLPYSPLVCGAISGKYLGGKRPEGTRWAIEQEMGRQNQRATSTLDDAVQAYLDLANRHGLDVCQMALAFCYQQNFVTSTIIGATTMEQLKSNVEAKDITLSDDILNEIQKIYCGYPMPY